MALLVAGAANAPYFVAAALQRVHLPLPGLGTLQDGLNSLLLFEFGVCNAQGRELRVYPVPNRPGLVGVTLWWQTLAGNPTRLGNLEATQLQRP